MISRVEPLTAPDVAVIWGLPIAAALASPAVMDANVVSEELQVTEEVMSAMLPSLNDPFANCWVDPAGTDGSAGVIWMDVSVFGGGGGGDSDPPQPHRTKALTSSASKKKPKKSTSTRCFETCIIPQAGCCLCPDDSGHPTLPRRQSKRHPTTPLSWHTLPFLVQYLRTAA